MCTLGAMDHGVLPKHPGSASLKTQHSAGCAGIPWDGSNPSWDSMWQSVQAVWASKWNARAVSSLHKAGLLHRDLQMAVLCQAVVPAGYSFVAHTTNPITGASTTP